MESEQKRAFMWTVPRCLSSAFFRAINNASGTKGIFEPFCQAYYLGVERTSHRYSKDPPIDDVTYADIKALLEGPYVDQHDSHVLPTENDILDGEMVVFVKDLAYTLLAGPQPPLDMLPTGYQHTFLIRDPRKSLPSLYKISTNKDDSGWDYFEPMEAGFKELYQLFVAVTETLGQEAIILDADDLLSHPEDMLHQYCERTGIEFQQVMIHWNEAPPEKMDAFKDWPIEWFSGWFKTMLSSTTFNKPTNPGKFIDVSNQPPDVQQAIRESQPYYDKLYNMRMLPRK